MNLAGRMGFRGRLIAAMIALVVLVSLVIGALLMVYLFEDEKSRAMQQLAIGERMAREVLERRTDLNLSRLSVVVQDFGFRSAVASGDPGTLDSALENHSRRARADFALLTNSAGDLLASTLNQQIPDASPPLSQPGSSPGSARTFIHLGGQGYEVLNVPVEGPGLRATLMAGFALDQPLANLIARLSGTEVIFRARTNADEAFRVLAATGNREMPMEQELTPAPQARSLLDPTRYFSRTINLGGTSASEIEIVLMISREASLQNYYTRAKEIALLVSAILVFAILLALIIARYLGKPLLQLADYARAVGDGENPKPPEFRTGGELKQLRNALGDMLVRLREREAQIRYAATHDDVTGLGNRNALMQSVRELFEVGNACTLIGMRLEDLSDVNDTLGLEFGDRVLAGISERLQAELPNALMIARTGGGEFLALVPPRSPDRVDSLTRRLHGVIESPLQINNTPFSIRAIMVTMELPEDAANTNELRRRLNLTFERAQDHPEPITRYRPGQDESHLRELQLIADLHTAIADNSLHMNYQPKLNSRTGQLEQLEALVRWIHPELGFVPPEEFISLAEKSGQINDLTAHILKRVATDARAWNEQGVDAGVAINLSAKDLTWPALADHVAETFADWHHHLERITLEVTESALMEDPVEALATLHRLKALGVTLSVDDFGTGYSSLSQLRTLPVQELKIDKSFVLKLESEPQDQLIVRSTIDMAHGLGLKVVAEGVESLQGWQLLQQWGCDLAQGFYLSRPVAAADLAETAQALAARHQELAQCTMEYSR
ncbi:putative bifunctional diguanylate cyclase/phosphodiesterase [Marinobacter arenosus]|uniref:putative bifunctional diguanylate cyclase/phosphodiesterase n=1 Tax=Marinobacter arenosus TaxID=2856822 RepID=UPI001C4DC01C|nr:GGDEF domain-containing phosphodiesterase [Marinobacter arenosus]MBW0148153.1 EAL domain-containing protein [Marinobacter arenosus]